MSLTKVIDITHIVCKEHSLNNTTGYSYTVTLLIKLSNGTTFELPAIFIETATDDNDAYIQAKEIFLNDIEIYGNKTYKIKKI